MVKRSTVVWFSLAAIAGYAMYQLKYDVIALEEELAASNRQILAYQESIHVLNAEWAYLNDPARLQQLADRYLDLRPIAADEEVEISTLFVRDDTERPAAEVPLPRPKPTWLSAAIERSGN